MKIALDKLNTELQNEHTMDIDQCSTEEALRKINEEDQLVAHVVREQIPAIAKLIDCASTCLKQGGRLIYVGAGTSGRLGILDASECPPTYGVSADLVQGLIAGGVPAVFKAQEGAEDCEELGKEDLMNINLQPCDMVIGLAASGRTPYVIGALKYANEMHAQTGSICCVQSGEISSYATYPIEAVTGAEAITGSTRMKAGTAQKMILNMISTSCMIKLGKVYHNLMVDLQPTNQKLEQRACGIIKRAINCTQEEAEQLFLQSDKDVKTAIVMGVTKVNSKDAKEMLQEHQGNVANTIRILKKEEF